MPEDNFLTRQMAELAAVCLTYEHRYPNNQEFGERMRAYILKGRQEKESKDGMGKIRREKKHKV
jgi:hypothetical protein